MYCIVGIVYKDMGILEVYTIWTNAKDNRPRHICAEFLSERRSLGKFGYSMKFMA